MRVAAGLLAAACGLAACSDGGSGGDASGGSYKDRLAEADRLVDRVEDLGTTAPGDLPASGSARFEGTAGVAFEGTGGSTSLLGDAVVVADFGDGSIDGEATNFFGRVEDGSVTDLDGTLEMAGGDIDGSGAEAGLSGTLRGDGHVVEVDADLDGGFLGRGGEAIALQDFSSFGTVDGEGVLGGVEVLAVRP